MIYLWTSYKCSLQSLHQSIKYKTNSLLLSILCSKTKLNVSKKLNHWGLFHQNMYGKVWRHFFLNIPIQKKWIFILVDVKNLIVPITHQLLRKCFPNLPYFFATLGLKYNEIYITYSCMATRFCIGSRHMWTNQFHYKLQSNEWWYTTFFKKLRPGKKTWK